LTSKRTFGGHRSRSSEITTSCLTTTVETLEQSLPRNSRRSNLGVQTEDVQSVDKKRIGETLNRCYQMVKRPRIFPSGQPTIFNSTDRPIPLTPDSHETLYSNSVDVIALAEQLGEVEGIVTNLLALECHSTHVSNMSRYLSTSMLRLYTEELGLRPRKRQTKASMLLAFVSSL
jgi:hypothetical protein